MSERRFVRRHSPEWGRMERILAAQQRSPAGADPTFPSLYRRLCQQLALARHRSYGGVVIERLNALALQGQRQLYQRARVPFSAAVATLLGAFPRTVRQHRRTVLWAHLLFYGAALAMFIAVSRQPDLAHSLVPPEALAEYEAMYQGAEGLPGRGADSDVAMFGFYIQHNVGIAFRTFAGGVLCGVGSLVVLLYNALFMGTIFAYLGGRGLGDALFSFVIGHSSFELTAIVLSAVAGLELGLAATAPGHLPRGLALRRAAQRVAPMLYGFAAMLVLAAFIEAFWSSTTWLPSGIKYGVGVALWLAVWAWLLLGGRRRAAG